MNEIVQEQQADNDSAVVSIRFKPVMQTAVDLLPTLLTYKILVLQAAGDAIPNAVAVANILREKIRKDSVKIKGITIDSVEQKEQGPMKSTIEIVLELA